MASATGVYTPEVRQASTLDAIARTLAVAAILVLLCVSFRAFNAGDRPFLAYAMIGAAVVQCAYMPNRREMAITAVVALAVSALYSLLGGAIGNWASARITLGLASLGLASTIVLGWKACRSTQALKTFLLATYCPLLAVASNVALAVMISAAPQTYDLFLYRFDGAFGGQPSFAVGRLFESWPFLRAICFEVYAALPLAAAVWFVLYVTGEARMNANPLKLFAAAGFAGAVLYQICPATGPAHIFGRSFPAAAPHAAAVFTSVGLVPRNAMPSLHSAWTLLLWWNMRNARRWIQWAAGAFVAFTLLATLGFGEHYLIDLIVAVPFASAVQLAVEKRWAACSATSLITLAWLGYFRTAPQAIPAPWLAWALAGATVAVPVAIALRDWKPGPAQA